MNRRLIIAGGCTVAVLILFQSILRGDAPDVQTTAAIFVCMLALTYAAERLLPLGRRALTSGLKAWRRLLAHARRKPKE